MTEVKFHFDDEFQLGIFEIMMIDSKFCETVISKVKPEYFKNEFYAFFFNTIKNLFEEYKSIPSHLQLRNEIMKMIPEKRERYLLIFNRIIKPTLKRDYSYIKNNLTKFCKKAVNFHIYDAIKNNNNADPEHVNQMIEKMIDDQKSIDFASTSCQKISQLSSIMEASSQVVEEVVPTFLPTIDRELNGGVTKGTLTIGLSGTNVGKSIWMINWAYHLIKAGHKVLYINLEGYENQTILRLASRAIGAFMGDVRFNRLNDIEIQRRNEFEQKYKDSIQIFHNSSFEFCLEDLIPIIRQKKEEFDFDVLFIDYIQILKTKKKYSELRHEQAYTHRAISSICSELNIAGVSVAQGTRDTQEKNQKGNAIIRSNDISECFEIARAAATILTLNRSDADIENDTARIFLDKSRDGKTGIIEVCKTNFARMAFYGDHTEGLGYMSMSDYIKGSNE